MRTCQCDEEGSTSFRKVGGTKQLVFECALFFVAPKSHTEMEHKFK